MARMWHDYGTEIDNRAVEKEASLEANPGFAGLAALVWSLLRVGWSSPDPSFIIPAALRGKRFVCPC